MKVKVSAIMMLNDKVFGPFSKDRTKMDVLAVMGRMIREGKGIEHIFIESFEFIEKEKE